MCVCVCAPPFPQTPYCQQRQHVQHLVVNPPVSPRSIAHISMYIYIHSLLFVDDSQVPPRSITHISIYTNIYTYICMSIAVCGCVPKYHPARSRTRPYMGIYMHHCVCVCVCMCVYVCSPTRVRTCTQSHTHTQTLSHSLTHRHTS